MGMRRVKNAAYQDTIVQNSIIRGLPVYAAPAIAGVGGAGELTCEYSRGIGADETAVPPPGPPRAEPERHADAATPATAISRSGGSVRGYGLDRRPYVDPFRTRPRRSR